MLNTYKFWTTMNFNVYYKVTNNTNKCLGIFHYLFTDISQLNYVLSKENVKSVWYYSVLRKINSGMLFEMNMLIKSTKYLKNKNFLLKFFEVLLNLLKNKNLLKYYLKFQFLSGYKQY